MSLLKLSIDNQFLSLPDNFVVRMTFKMPLPYLDHIPAAITYWFNLPSNKVNDPIFRHANYIYSSGKLRAYDCILDVAGLQMKGKLYLKNANTLQYKAFIVFNDLIENLSAKKLPSILEHSYHIGDDPLSIIDEMKRMQQLTWPDVPYGFPSIVNKDFFGGNEQNFSGIMNYFFEGSGGVYFRNYYDSEGDITHNRTAMVPQPYLLHILNEVFTFAGFQASGDVLQDANFNKMLVYSNFAVQKFSKIDYFKGVKDLIIAPVDSVQTNLDIALEVEDSHDCFDLSTDTYTSGHNATFVFRFKADVEYSGTGANGSTFSVYVKHGTDVVAQIATGTAVNGSTTYIEGETEYTADAPSFNFFISCGNAENNGSVTATAIELEIYPKIHQNVDDFGSDIELKNHVPDITCSEFINGMAKKFCLATFFDAKDKKVEFAFWKDVLKSAYLDLSPYLVADSEQLLFEEKVFSLKANWENDALAEGNFTVEDDDGLILASTLETEYPMPGEIGQQLFIKPANLVYRSAIGSDGQLAWEYDTDFFQDITSESVEAESLDIPIGTLLVRDSERIIFDVHYGQYLPAISQTGSSQQTGQNEPGFKIYNNHGIVAVDSYYSNATLPFASNSKYDYNGNDIGGYNMNMAADDGLYNELHKALYDYIASRNQVEARFDINDSIFHKLFALFKPNQTTRRVRVGARNYLPELVDISIGLNSFKSCKIKLR